MDVTRLAFAVPVLMFGGEFGLLYGGYRAVTAIDPDGSALIAAGPARYAALVAVLWTVLAVGYMYLVPGPEWVHLLPGRKPPRPNWRFERSRLFQFGLQMASAAAVFAPHSSQLPGWSVGLLFLVSAVVGLIFQFVPRLARRLLL